MMPRTLLQLAFLVVSFFACYGNGYADTVYLKNGRHIEGIIRKETEEKVELDIGFGLVGFKKSEIVRIEKADQGGQEAIQREWARQKLISQKKEQEVKDKLESAPKRVDMVQEKGHIFVNVLINKKVSAKLLMDTGATLIVLNSSVAKKLGVSTEIDLKKKPQELVQLVVADGRKVNAKRVILASVSVQDQTAENVEAALVATDDMDFQNSEGVLGMSFLKRFNFKMDFKNNKLVLEKIK